VGKIRFTVPKSPETQKLTLNLKDKADKRKIVLLLNLVYHVN